MAWWLKLLENNLLSTISWEAVFYLSGLWDKTFYSSQILLPPQKEISEERTIENQVNALHIKLYVRMSVDQISVKLLTLVSVVKLVWKVNTPITLEGTLEIVQGSLLLKALKSDQDFVQPGFETPTMANLLCCCLFNLEWKAFYFYLHWTITISESLTLLPGTVIESMALSSLYTAPSYPTCWRKNSDYFPEAAGCASVSTAWRAFCPHCQAVADSCLAYPIQEEAPSYRWF